MIRENEIAPVIRYAEGAWISECRVHERRSVDREAGEEKAGERGEM
jgi:hypothetical protein